MFIGLFICRPALRDLVISERSSVRTSITCLSAGSTTTGNLILVVSSWLVVVLLSLYVCVSQSGINAAFGQKYPLMLMKCTL